MQKISEDELLKMLQSVETIQNDRVFRYLYRQLFPQVLRHIRLNNGGLNEAEDVFQDSLIALYKMARRERLPEQIKIEAYFFSICKNLWLKQLQKQKNKGTVELTEEANHIPIENVGIQSIFSEERKRQLEELMKNLGEGCHKVLLYFYYDRRSMKEIAELLGFANEQVAKNKKSKCLKKLKALVLKSPRFSNYFR